MEPDLDVPYTIFGYFVPVILADGMFMITQNVEYIGGDDTKKEYLPHKTIRFDIFKVTLEEGPQKKKKL